MSWAITSSNHSQRIRKGSGTEESFSLLQPQLVHTEARRDFWTLPFPEFWPCCVSGFSFWAPNPAWVSRQTWSIWMKCSNTWCFQETSYQVSAARNWHQALLPSSFRVGRSLALSEGAVILLMSNFLLMNKPWMNSLAENPLNPISGPSPLLVSNECAVYTHDSGWLVHLLLFRAH